jgi:hypothetical protein
VPAALLAQARLDARDGIALDNGGLSPSKLPRHGVAPVTARLEAEVGTLDGSHPPALSSVDILVSKSVGVDARGLPVCAAKDLQARPTKAAEAACGDALVGRGSAEVEVAFPEQKPFRSTGPVLLFNAGIHGATTRVLLHAYVDVPAPTAIVTLAEVTRVHRGPYGLEITAHIPRIAGGAGSVTKFTIGVGRRFAYRGESRSFVSAGCPAGRWGARAKPSSATAPSSPSPTSSAARQPAEPAADLLVAIGPKRSAAREGGAPAALRPRACGRRSARPTPSGRSSG